MRLDHLYQLFVYNFFHLFPTIFQVHVRENLVVDQNVLEWAEDNKKLIKKLIKIHQNWSEKIKIVKKQFKTQVSSVQMSEVNSEKNKKSIFASNLTL